jgi:hypothetical protein
MQSLAEGQKRGRKLRRRRLGPELTAPFGRPFNEYRIPDSGDSPRTLGGSTPTRRSATAVIGCGWSETRNDELTNGLDGRRPHKVLHGKKLVAWTSRLRSEQHQLTRVAERYQDTGIACP